MIANERNRRPAHYRRLLRQRMERELPMQQNLNSQIDPPSYHVAIDIIDPRPPPPTYGQHRRDTRIASLTQQQQQQ
ncbi:hypothetical protein INT45_004750 [Circinella minor]|uniref:Uncharacterized protein n=1 Tax=Circinella minor TaxID=1195481 RepID=A0A8H7VT12_9FUNG|nr:hypothetical protein INT45_004750 [Circinella minor]